MEKRYTIAELKVIVWTYIGRHGTVLTNGTIDYIVEQAIKEWEQTH